MDYRYTYSFYIVVDLYVRVIEKVGLMMRTLKVNIDA